MNQRATSGRSSLLLGYEPAAVMPARGIHKIVDKLQVGVGELEMHQADFPLGRLLCLPDFGLGTAQIIQDLALAALEKGGRVAPAQCQCAGMTTGSPRFFSSTTRNLAGLVALALRPIVCTSLGPS